MTGISMGENYEERMFGTVGGRYVSSVEIKVIFEYLKPRKDDKVLDVGTGTGRIARPLASYVKELIGLDQDRTVLKVALIKAKQEGITNYSAVIGSGEYLPFKEKCFDKLICVRSLKYFKDYMKSLREMSCSLKNGGTLILEVSNVLGWAVIVRLPKIFLTGSLGYPKLFTLGDMAKKLWNNGFAIVDRYALHKVEPMLFNKINNRYMTRILMILDSTLHKLTPFELFSRGILLNCLKLSSRGGIRDEIAKDIRMAHDRIAKNYGSKKFGNRIETIVKRLIDKDPCLQHSICLDAGCGNGQFTSMLLEAGFNEVVGVDFSRKMLTETKERAKRCRNEERLHLIEGDIRKNCFRKSSFDLVFMYGLIEHVDEPKKVIKNLVEMIKENGLITFDIPRKGSLSQISFILFGQNPKYWGLKGKVLHRLKLREKSHYYKFYSGNEVCEWIEHIERCRIVKRIPTSYSSNVFMNFLMMIQNKRLVRCIVTVLEKLAQKLMKIPAGEIVAIRKLGCIKSSEHSN